MKTEDYFRPNLADLIIKKTEGFLQVLHKCNEATRAKLVFELEDLIDEYKKEKRKNAR